MRGTSHTVTRDTGGSRYAPFGLRKKKRQFRQQTWIRWTHHELASRDELFTAREGTLSLRNMESRFLANMAEVEIRSDRYTDRFALFQLPRYLGGEALEVYLQHSVGTGGQGETGY